MSKPIKESISKAETSKVRFSELGISGLNYDKGGYVLEEFLPALQGEKALKVYREMKDNDPIVGATLFTIEMITRQIPWTAEAAGNSAAEIADKEFLEGVMNDMSHTWSDFMGEAMSAVPFGWAYFEIVYKRRQGWNRMPSKKSEYDDNKIGWRKFGIRAQSSLDRWEFGDDGGIRGMYQNAAPDYEEQYIPIEKAVLFRAASSKNNPEGRSALRNAYRPWFFKKRIEELEGIGVERDLAGIPMVYVDPSILAEDATDEQKRYLASIQEMVKNIRLDQQVGIILPASYDEQGRKLFEFELLGGPGSKQFATDQIIERYDNRIAMTVLADFILLGHQNMGSFALASSRSNLFAHAIESWANSFEDTLNRHVVPKLFRLNGRTTENLPKIKHGDISTPDLPEIAAFIAQTAGAGMPWFPDERLEEHIRNIAKLPPVPPGGVPVPADNEPVEPQGKPMEPGEKEEDRRRQPRRLARQTPRGTPDTPEETQRGI